MRKYSSYNQLIQDLTRDVSTSLKEVKTSFIDGEMKKAIQEVVYDDPNKGRNPYIRRMDNGGLSDVSNFEVQELSVLNKSVNMTIKNMTPFAGDDKHHNSSNTHTLDKVIVTGIGYTWQKSRYAQREHAGSPIKRDFYQETANKIDDKLANKLYAQLKRHGW